MLFRKKPAVSEAAVRPYVELMRHAAGGHISLEKFALDFMALFSADQSQWPRDLYEILNDVFLDADEYVPSHSENFGELKNNNPQLVIGDDEFMERLNRALSKLAGSTSSPWTGMHPA